MAKKKKYYSIKLAILIPTVAITIFVLLLFLLLSITVANKTAYNKVKTETILATQTYKVLLENELEKNILIVKNLQNILQNYSQINESIRRSYYYNFLKEIILVNPKINNIFTIWKPYSFDKFDYKYKDLFLGYNGQYAVWINRNSLKDSILPSIEKLNLLDLYENKFLEYKSDLIVLSPLRIEQINEKNIYAVRVLGAIRDKQNKLLGIVGIDIALDAFINHLSMKELENIIILNDELKIIFSPDKRFIGKDVKVYNSSLISSSLYTSLVNNKSIFYKFDDPNGKYIYITAQPINYSKRFWTLIRLITKQEYKQILNTFSWRIRTFSTLLILLVIFMLTGYFIVLLKIIKFQNDLVKRIYYNLPLEESFNIFRLNYKELIQIANMFKKLEEKNKERLNFINSLNSGNYDINDLKPTSENDLAAYSLNKLKENLKKTKKIQEQYRQEQEEQNWKNTGLTKFNEILRTYINDVEKLAEKTISNLTDYLDAQVGAFFLLTEKGNKQILELVGYYGYNRRIYEKKFFELGEGLSGNVALEKKLVITNVPNDYVELATGLGKAAPNYIAVFPLMIHEVIYGVIEIAKIDEFKQYQIDFLNEISQVIASYLATVKINEETKKLLEKSRQATKQMQEKEIELGRTIKELEKLQIEAQLQKQQLESIFSALNEIVFYAEFSKKMRILSINKQIEDKFNITYNEVAEKNFFDLFKIPVDKIDYYKNIWQNVLKAHKQNFDLEIHLETKTIWIKASLVPIVKGLEIDRVLFIGIDTTSIMEQKNKLDKLIIENKEKEEKLSTQQREIKYTFNELKEVNLKLEEKEKYTKKIEKELDNLKQKHQSLKKEFEKQLSHSRKIETVLRKKIDQLQEQIEELKNKNDKNKK